MTDLLEKAVAAARMLSSDIQDDIARMVLLMASEGKPEIKLSPEEEASFAVSLAQADRREFASDDQVRAVWSKHRL